MTENEWTKRICNMLQVFLESHKLYADTLVKVPYSQEISGYSISWEPEYMAPSLFETDLLIYEKKKGKIIPRVIIESKINKISTHDAITYSYKAEKHKNITPYLRYGIMLGNRHHYPLPGRLFRHGTSFDFMFKFAGFKPTDREWEVFTRMILKEVKFSQTIEEMLHESKSKGRKKYFMLQKQIVLAEQNEME